jgi:hypothetical protein
VERELLVERGADGTFLSVHGMALEVHSKPA